MRFSVFQIVGGLIKYRIYGSTCVSRARGEAFRQWESGLQATRPPLILSQERVTRRLDAAMDIQDIRRDADPDSEDLTDTAAAFMQTGHGPDSDMPARRPRRRRESACGLATSSAKG